MSFLNDAALGPEDTNTKDWASEAPHSSRLAVPYDDLTAIDWIHEYARERSRKRLLHTNSAEASSIFDSFRDVVDDSHAWIVLVLTGVAVGAIAAGIDVCVDWLGDLKTGVCSNVQDGGRFWLNRGFCCWGYEGWSWPSFSTSCSVCAD